VKKLDGAAAHRNTSCPNSRAARELRLSELPPGRRVLVRLMRDRGFGTILRLHVRDREPVLDPAPEVVREVKLGATREERPGGGEQDFTLKAQVVDLFEQLDALGSGSIESLEIQNGLPFRLRLRSRPGGGPCRRRP
jgi:hypothetical protein